MRRTIIALLLATLCAVWLLADKPTAGATLNSGNTYYTNLLYVYPMWTLTDTELRSGASTTAGGGGTYDPTATTAATWGGGWANNGTTGRVLLSGQNSLTRNRARFAMTMLIKTGASLPGAGLIHQYLWEGCSDNGTSGRFGIAVVNGALNATGIKLAAYWRAGLSGSTRQDVNAGAGGTTIEVNTEYAVGFDFNADTDVYTLYINGNQEAQSTVTESAIMDTASATGYTSRWLSAANGGSPAVGSVHHFAMWSEPLGAAGHAALASNPWRFYTGHDSATAKPRSPIIAMVPQTRMAW